MLRLLPEYQDSALTRSRDPAVLEECDIIVDVTESYLPTQLHSGIDETFHSGPRPVRRYQAF